MPILRVGPLMRYYIDNKSEVIVRGATVVDALQDAVLQHPALKFHVFDSAGKIRRHINIFVNDQNIRDLQGLQTRLDESDRIILMASISGG
ncbi:MAG: MoaD/ThiS family protein [Chloroflexi bacterium]|nr:MoaD/ThiS family protein [Chloroflexota bacterium]MBI3339548.1 MoaD/ThiS family protein [Chloroflexota bacterium]